MMKNRFSGTEGHRRLVDALQKQQIVRGDAALADHLAPIAVVGSYSQGDYLTLQGADDNDLYLLLAGRVSVVINGQELAQRSARTHIGEMSLIDPAARRSASCIALEETVAARISEPAFSDLANRFPVLWRNVALVLGDRLRQRTQYVRLKNETPILFIASSRESLPIAFGLKAGLAAIDVVVRVWPDGVFMPSNFPIEDLARELELSDFAVLVFGPDDKVISRRLFSSAPRDNVIFETGLFMGALRRQRTLIVKNRGITIKIPSDLFGLTPLEFADGRPHDLLDRLAPVCAAISTHVIQHGSR